MLVWPSMEQGQVLECDIVSETQHAISNTEVSK